MFGRFSINDNLDSSNDKDVKFTMKEFPDKYCIYGNLPGVGSDDINIYYDDDYIKISVRVNKSMSRGGFGGSFTVNQASNVSKEFYVPKIEVNKIKVDFDGFKLALMAPKIMKYSKRSIIEVKDYTVE
ncbi:hypothetical protein [Clostridium sp.]|uniref:hypothetical protein n=1 Tax=Clostridium sp. TaxID=1506 RepID=UPI00346426DE